jgi:tRNA nucleotidyltransferase/poly(A) polymerase
MVSAAHRGGYGYIEGSHSQGLQSVLTLLNLFCDFAVDNQLTEDAFIVGGTVRDLLLGREIKDADIVVKGDAEKIGRSFSDAIGASFVLLDRDFGIVRVAKNSEYIDICAMYGSSILNDLANRDLTINSMAIPLSTVGRQKAEGGSEDLKKSIIDPFDGRHDLKYKIIRMVSEENLVKDPLRLLRVYRFAATLDFSVEVHTSSAVRAHAPMISSSAAERIAVELRHIVRTASSYSTIKEMEKDGLLFSLFPELTELAPDIWHHTRQAYGYVDHILQNIPLYFPGKSATIQEYFADERRTFCLKFAILFQDSITAEKVAFRLKLSRRESEFMRMLEANSNVITALVNNLKPAVIGILREFGDDIYALLVYILAAGRVCQSSGSTFAALAREIAAVYQDEYTPRLSRLPLIDGNDLISEFGLSPSPFFKDILSAVELLSLEGRITSRAEAISEAGRMIRMKGIGS